MELGGERGEASAVDLADANVGVVQRLRDVTPHRLKALAMTAPRSVELYITDQVK